VVLETLLLSRTPLDHLEREFPRALSNDNLLNLLNSQGPWPSPREKIVVQEPQGFGPVMKRDDPQKASLNCGHVFVMGYLSRAILLDASNDNLTSLCQKLDVAILLKIIEQDLDKETEVFSFLVFRGHHECLG
jgi:hypothetical protein